MQSKESNYEGGDVKAVDALLVRRGSSTGEAVELNVAVETPVGIFVNGRQIATVFTTPSMLKELAIGYMLGEGIIRSLGEVATISEVKSTIRVNTISDVSKRVHAAKEIRVIESACGSTEDFYRLLDRVEKPRVKSQYSVTVDDIRRMTRELNFNAQRFHKGAAVHSAAIFQNGEMVTFAEDVSRHNATDKVVGAAAMKKIDFSKSVLMGTGRQPASMIIKVARAGIPISVSVRGPIHSGIYVAKMTNVTLACFGREPGLAIYSHPERIKGTGATLTQLQKVKAAGRHTSQMA
jgi:formate dehydrogenase accessory protein FdhD